MARARVRRKDQPDWTPIKHTLLVLCPLCGVSSADEMTTHLESHAPRELCQRCDGKEKGWRLDTDGAVHFRAEVGMFYCSNCGRYAPVNIREKVN